MSAARRVAFPIAVVLAAALFVIAQSVLATERDALTDSIDGDLHAFAESVAVVGRPGGDGIGRINVFSDDDFAQIVSADGRRVLQWTYDTRPVLDLRGNPELPQLRTRNGYRVLAIRTTKPYSGEPSRIVVVGTTLVGRDEQLDKMRHLLLILGVPAWLILTALAYWCVARVLRPIDALRRQAAGINGPERLPEPKRDDELGRLARTLNEMLARLEGSRQRERRFVDDASHELRTPLSVLRTELELALRQGESETALRTAIGSSIEEVDRLSELSEALLQLAGGGMQARRDPIRASELLAGVAERAGEGVRVGGIEPAGLLFSGDRLLLEQALNGLVANALRHGAPPVELQARRRHGEVELTVTDAGPGFPPGFSLRAFERFSRGDEARGRGGVGLGLSIVDMIARAHGGTAVAGDVSRLGGAQVTLTLPV